MRTRVGGTAPQARTDSVRGTLRPWGLSRAQAPSRARTCRPAEWPRGAAWGPAGGMGDLEDGTIALTHRDASSPAQAARRFALAGSADEVEAFLPLARAAHEESVFSFVAFDEAKARRLGIRALERPDRHGTLLAWHRDRPAGFLLCSAGEYMIGGGAILVTIQALFVDPGLRRGLSGGRLAMGLLAGAKSWARARKAAALLMHVTSGVAVARTHRMVRRSQGGHVGGNYVWSLRN